MINAESQDKSSDPLAGIPEFAYGSAYESHLLELYKLYVERADCISDRRERANSFFLTINTALVALLAKDAFKAASAIPRFLEVLVPLAAVVLCYLWYRIIRSYRDLNSAKFKIIHRIESNLPIRPYYAEWEAVGRGKNSNLYLPFTHIEIAVPWLFLIFHVILAISAILWPVVCRIAG